MKLENKAALVTGGASGLGLAATKELLAHGASVVIVDLPRSNGSAVAEELGDKVRFSPAYLTAETEVRDAVEVAAGEFGGLHVVVNCAGVGFPGRVLTREGAAIDLERFEFVVRVNLIGTFNVIRLAAAQMAS